MVHLDLSKEEIEIIIAWAESVENEWGAFNETTERNDIDLIKKLEELLKST